MVIVTIQDGSGYFINLLTIIDRRVWTMSYRMVYEIVKDYDIG